MLSFAGPVTFRNADGAARGRAAWCPADQLLVETDAPFLTPHPHRGRANEPYCLPWTVRGLAELRGVPDERLAADARRNRRAGVPARRAAARRSAGHARRGPGARSA